MGELLTDPQITSNLYVSSILVLNSFYWSFTSIHGNLFGDGNLPIAFKEFRKNHECNHYCTFFSLKLDILPLVDGKDEVR